jgi:hypothetical protein
MKIEVFRDFFLEGAEAMEEDAEGMLRPKPKEQPMPKLRRGMGDLSVWSFRGCRKQSGADGTDAEVYRGMCVVRERTWVFGVRRDPPERLLIAPLYSGGQSGEVVWDASISFGFLGVCSFSGFPSG